MFVSSEGPLEMPSSTAAINPARLGSLISDSEAGGGDCGLARGCGIALSKAFLEARSGSGSGFAPGWQEVQ